MHKFKLILIVAVSIFVGFSIGQYEEETHTLELELSEALPTWIPFRKEPKHCLEPSEGELALLDNMALSLEILNQEEIFHSSLGIGIQKFLSSGIYRSVGSEHSIVCTPPGYFKRIAEAIAASNSMKAYIVKYQLTLAGRMKEPSDEIVEEIAKVAFSELHINTYPDHPITLKPITQ